MSKGTAIAITIVSVIVASFIFFIPVGFLAINTLSQKITEKNHISASIDNATPKKPTDSETSKTIDKTKEEPKANNKVQVGQSFSTDQGLTVKLIGITKSKGGTFVKPDNGNSLFLMEMEITNNGNEEVIISSILQFEGYIDGVKSEYRLNETGQTLDATLATGRKLVGAYVVEGPSSAKIMEVDFTPKAFGPEKITLEAKIQ